MSIDIPSKGKFMPTERIPNKDSFTPRIPTVELSNHYAKPYLLEEIIKPNDSTARHEGTKNSETQNKNISDINKLDEEEVATVFSSENSKVNRVQQINPNDMSKHFTNEYDIKQNKTIPSLNSDDKKDTDYLEKIIKKPTFKTNGKDEYQEKENYKIFNNFRFEENENGRYANYGENGNVNGVDYIFIDKEESNVNMKGADDITKDCHGVLNAGGSCKGSSDKLVLDSLKNPSPSFKPSKKVTETSISVKSSKRLTSLSQNQFVQKGNNFHHILSI